jgi:hypothetical protein
MVFERKILRKIFGPAYENGFWRIKTNQELNKIIKQKNIINFARAQRLGWLGHIERMPETRTIKAKHSWKFQRGQQEDQTHAGRMMLKKDIQKLKVPNWRTLVQDRKR